MFRKIFRKVENCQKTLKKMFVIPIPVNHFFISFRKIPGRFRKFSGDFHAHIINIMKYIFSQLCFCTAVHLNILLYEEHIRLINSKYYK